MAQTEQVIDHVLFTVEVNPLKGGTLHRAVCTCGHATEWRLALDRLLEEWATHRIQTEHQWFRDLAATTLYAAEARQ